MGVVVTTISLDGQRMRQEACLNIVPVSLLKPSFGTRFSWVAATFMATSLALFWFIVLSSSLLSSNQLEYTEKENTAGVHNGTQGNEKCLREAWRAKRSEPDRIPGLKQIAPSRQTQQNKMCLPNWQGKLNRRCLRAAYTNPHIPILRAVCTLTASLHPEAPYWRAVERDCAIYSANGWDSKAKKSEILTLSTLKCHLTKNHVWEPFVRGFAG